jgi:hypothetical protein
MQCADTASAGFRRCGSRRSATCGWDMSPTVPTRKEAVEDREACGCSNALRTSACDRRTFRRLKAFCPAAAAERRVKMTMLMLKTVKIRSYEAGLLFRDGEFKGLLADLLAGHHERPRLLQPEPRGQRCPLPSPGRDGDRADVRWYGAGRLVQRCHPSQVLPLSHAHSTVSP